MKTDKLYELKLNQMKEVCIHEDLTDFEKGEIFFDFMHRYGLTQKQVGELIGMHRNKVNRCVLVYKRYNEMNEHLQKKLSKVGDRMKLVVTRLDGPQKEAKLDFILENRKGLPQGDIEKIVGILNGTITIEEYEKKVKRDYNRRMNIIKKIRMTFTDENFIKIH